MPVSPQQALLDFFQEPILVLNMDGVILEANGAAHRALGPELLGHELTALLASPAEEFLAWLNRCSGTTTPLMGAVHLRQPDGGACNVRLKGARLRPSDGAVRMAVRFLEIDPRRFLLLKREVEDLNATARESMRREAVLAEALRNNQGMLSELNHRVKNNIQLMVGMLSATGRESSSPEVRDTLQLAINRLLAVGAAQKLTYATPEVTSVAAASLLRALTDTLAGMHGRTLQLDLDGTEGRLSNDIAFPLAIMVSELVTDVARQMASGGDGTIRIAFARRGDAFALTVHGDGQPIDPPGPERRSAGLGLVRGLCSQIGGEMDVSGGGAQVTLRFTCPQMENGA